MENGKEKKEMLVEDYALALDYMPKGKSTSFKEEPLAQLLGEKYFTLLEVVPKGELKAMERVYIGKDEREKILFIKKRINCDELTSNSQTELENAIKKIMDKNTEKYLKFYNESGPITIRRHQLELLPGLGKKHMQDILAKREQEPFKSLKDLADRVPLLPNPEKTIIKRILKELCEPDLKHYLFARPPKKERPSFKRH